jgi:hypothetical protein
MIAAFKEIAVLIKAKIHWPPSDWTQGGELVEPRPERLAHRTLHHEQCTPETRNQKQRPRY